VRGVCLGAVGRHEELTDQWLEVLERSAFVVRIEGHSVVLSGELFGELVER
jgi:hypothetical protein